MFLCALCFCVRYVFVWVMFLCALCFCVRYVFVCVMFLCALCFQICFQRKVSRLFFAQKRTFQKCNNFHSSPYTSFIGKSYESFYGEN